MSFGAFLAVILGLFIPVVFLVTLFIQSDAQVRRVVFFRVPSCMFEVGRAGRLFVASGLASSNTSVWGDVLGCCLSGCPRY